MTSQISPFSPKFRRYFGEPLLVPFYTSLNPDISGTRKDITEVTKSECNRRWQRKLQIFLKKFTFEAWKINVKSCYNNDMTLD